MAKLTDDELRAIVGRRLSDTLSSTDSELRKDRVIALDHYYGRPYGNEIEGRSQIVTKDLMDTIEWIMPSLLRIFSNKDAVEFDPVGPEDEALAKQETLYVSHVLWKKNPGFMLMYNWLKDALMQKVGYVKYWWQDEAKLCFDSYYGLSEEQLVLTVQSLEQEGELEIVGSEQDKDTGYWNIKVKTKRKYGCAKIEVVPPDEVIVDKDCRGDIKSARFVGHLRRNITRSDLLEMGYSRKRVGLLNSYSWDKTSEALARDTVNESVDDADDGVDWATKELVLLDCYTYVDKDDDGIAELRHFLMGGNDILEDEEVSEIQFDSWTPIPVPHRHVGLSIDDVMEDLQRINTALNRGLLDNVYFTMNQRVMYDKNVVDVSMLQVNRPGGHVAVDGPPGLAAMPVPVSPMAAQLLPVIDYISQTRENRTGVGRMTSGVDADVLAQSTKGAYIDAKSAANQRIEAIARIFAETGLSSLYGSLHRLLSHHQDWETREKLKGQWVTVNPTEWQERANMTVSVGLGNSSKEEVRANLSTMASAQQAAAAVPGLIQPTNVFNLFNRLAAELGFDQSGFITDPKSPEYQQFLKSQQPPEDPYVQGVKIKSATDLQKAQIEAETDDEDRTAKVGIEMAKLAAGSHDGAQDRRHDMAKTHVTSTTALARGAQQASSRSQSAAGKPHPAGSGSR